MAITLALDFLKRERDLAEERRREGSAKLDALLLSADLQGKAVERDTQLRDEFQAAIQILERQHKFDREISSDFEDDLEEDEGDELEDDEDDAPLKEF